MAVGGNAKRNKHSAYIVMGILGEYRGKGIGAMLFKSWSNGRLTIIYIVWN